jgi:2-keto-4-pentenoate hydratase/2-oxohepta-3-ene-1,7-dioic acid hydratase in catechol pathway
MPLWARIFHEGHECFGTVDGDTIRLHDGDMFSSPRPTGRSVPLGATRWLTPTVPGKMVALVDNYRALVTKLDHPVPPEPLYFLKANNSFIAAGETIRAPKSYAGKVVFEGELGIVIGKTCRNVGRSEAARYIFGYTCVNDVTAMDVLFENPDFAQWSRSKSFDTFGCLGPSIATHIDPLTVNIVTRIDGSERQNYPVTDMVFKPLELVSLISHDLTLLPGDVIACGTSIGVGSIKDGATVEISIDGIGTLRNKLAA